MDFTNNPSSTNICDNNTTLPFTQNAMKVLTSRYLAHDVDGNVIETPEEMLKRVATHIASPEKDQTHWASKFENVMKTFEFIPAGRTLANAGAKTKLISNCVVLHMEDSLESIFETLKEAALLQQAGAGIGFPFHKLRPAGMQCKRSIGISSGPLSFLKIYYETFQIIQQHGRHGANMAIMRIDHPDILEFIEAKQNEGTFENFNFSISITDEFMERVLANDPSPWMCQWENIPMKPRHITRDSAGRVSDISECDISAPELFAEIIHFAWRNGEPGCVFNDTVNRENPLPGLGPIECCNPCGEQYLHSGDACNLGSINLEQFVTDGQIDYQRLKEVTRVAVRFLDNVVDLTEFPVERVQSQFQNNRRIGLGIMGLADMLFKLKVGYNTVEGREIAAAVMETIQTTAINYSEQLGMEKGSFPNFAKSKWARTKIAMRNASLTNVAPTGSTAILFDVSSGIEPYFALAYQRSNCLAGNMEPFVNKHLKAALESAGCFTTSIMDQILQTGSLQDIPEIPESIKKVFVTSLDIAAKDHIAMQAAVQKHCCNAISKTINFPFTTSEDDVRTGFIEAWKQGCKGITVYRNGSRDYQPVNISVKSDEPVRLFTDTCKDGQCDI